MGLNQQEKLYDISVHVFKLTKSHGTPWLLQGHMKKLEP